MSIQKIKSFPLTNLIFFQKLTNFDPQMQKLHNQTDASPDAFMFFKLLVSLRLISSLQFVVNTSNQTA